MTALIRDVPNGWSCSVKAERKREGERGRKKKKKKREEERRPQGVVLFRQGGEKEGRGGGEKEKKKKREREREQGQNGVPSVATRLIALANQISILAVALLLHAHYQKLIYRRVFIACHFSGPPPPPPTPPPSFLPSFIIQRFRSRADLQTRKPPFLVSRGNKLKGKKKAVYMSGECRCFHAGQEGSLSDGKQPGVAFTVATSRPHMGGL